MITFDPQKPKSITMVVEAQGIEPTNLSYIFRIMYEKVEYGFPCRILDGKITVDIPALSEVIKDPKQGQYEAKLEVIGENKYYLKPFEGTVEIKIDPKLNVSLEDETSKGLKESFTVAINSMFEDDTENKGEKPNVPEPKGPIGEKKDDKTSVDNKKTNKLRNKLL